MEVKNYSDRLFKLKIAFNFVSETVFYFFIEYFFTIHVK